MKVGPVLLCFVTLMLAKGAAEAQDVAAGEKVFCEVQTVPSGRPGSQKWGWTRAQWIGRPQSGLGTRVQLHACE